MQNGFLFHVWHYALHCTVHLQVAVQLPHPLESSCQAALPLLKHLAEMNYRSNDLMRAGLKAYLMGDLWEVCGRANKVQFFPCSRTAFARAVWALLGQRFRSLFFPISSQHLIRLRQIAITRSHEFVKLS